VDLVEELVSAQNTMDFLGNLKINLVSEQKD
jgi:hypothetical protein